MQLTPHVGDRTAPIRARWGSKSDRCGTDPGQISGLFCVRDCPALTTTCAVWPNEPGELAGSGTASDRCCPLRSGRSWPGYGPDVARWSRAWKARPVPSSQPGSMPMPQVTASWDRPLLTVSDRQMPMLRARGGHGRRGPTARQRGDGHKPNRRVVPDRDDHLPRWQAPAGRVAVPGATLWL
jgi:hypothetical protein